MGQRFIIAAMLKLRSRISLDYTYNFSFSVKLTFPRRVYWGKGRNILGWTRTFIVPGFSAASLASKIKIEIKIKKDLQHIMHISLIKNIQRYV